MKFLISLFTASIFSFPIFAQNTAAQNPPPTILSDTVATPDLLFIANVQAVASEKRAYATINLYKKIETDGKETYQTVTLASDETIIFSIGHKSMAYSLKTERNIIDLVPWGTYYVTFQRFNGEVYTAKAAAPLEQLQISSPLNNSSLKKSDAIEVHWNNIVGVAAVRSIFIVYDACKLTGTVAMNITSALIPAGYVSACKSPSQVADFIAIAIFPDNLFNGLKGSFNYVALDKIRFTLENAK